MRIDASPLYLDTSALAKLYIQEADSDPLDAALSGRRDLLVCELAATELTSALARRVREGSLGAVAARRIYNQLLRDLHEGEFRLVDLTAATHREAERMLMTVGRQTALRAADSLHLAAAALADARGVVTFDRQMRDAVLAMGSFTVFPT